MLWTLLIMIISNPSENIWNEFSKASNIGLSIESLNADFFSIVY